MKEYSLLNISRVIIFHGICILGLFTTEFKIECITLFLGSYFIRLPGISASYHRYFSHQSFETSRAFQFFLALLGSTTGQRGPLSWATNHRAHHQHSDKERDPHSPVVDNLFHAHIGWLLLKNPLETSDYDLKRFENNREILWINKYHFVGLILFVLILFSLNLNFTPAQLLMYGFFLPTCLLLHTTCAINSLGHGNKDKSELTGDYSKNIFWLFPFSLGDNWHRNHHAYPSSASNWFKYYEIDLVYLLIVLWSKLGLVWNLKTVSKIYKEKRLAS
jgi:stearoyl-CoA desaturase (delta-9 desaturase)